jgi:Holliday junction DNA helicase RuvA
VVNELEGQGAAAMAMGGDLAATELVTPDPPPTIATPVPAHPAPRRPRRSRRCRTSATPRRCGARGGGGGGTAPEAQTPEMIRAALRLLAPKE